MYFPRAMSLALSLVCSFLLGRRASCAEAKRGLPVTNGNKTRAKKAVIKEKAVVAIFGNRNRMAIALGTFHSVSFGVTVVKGLTLQTSDHHGRECMWPSAGCTPTAASLRVARFGTPRCDVRSVSSQSTPKHNSS